ncbi:MAG: type II secretion system F family protein [Bacteroidetes bacterium]|nr:type II secretion system F family protein [Bacteroidota bacterium]
MLVYYSGFNKEGDKFHRFDEVLDIEDIYDSMEKNDEDLLQLIEIPPALSFLGAAGSRKLKSKEVVEFCHHLVTYIDGGVDLGSIFKEIQMGPKNGPVEKVIKKISVSLTEGDSLSEAFKKTKSFPEILITLVEIGENSGNISQSLKDATKYLEREMELRSSTYRALIYPVFTITMMIIGLIVWVVFVIPQVVTLIENMDVELPIQTVILMKISSFMKIYWIFEVVFVFVISALIFIGRHFERFKYYLDKLWWYMPITGKVVASSEMAFYFNYFKVLHDSGVPVSEILIKLQQSVPNHFFRRKILISNIAIKEGGTLQSGYEKSKVYERMAIRIIGVGEKAGNIEKQLSLLAETYYRRVQLFVETLPKVLEPFFITTIGILFVLFASTLLGPLYEVIIKLGGNI